MDFEKHAENASKKASSKKQNKSDNKESGLHNSIVANVAMGVFKALPTKKKIGLVLTAWYLIISIIYTTYRIGLLIYLNF